MKKNTVDANKIVNIILDEETNTENGYELTAPNLSLDYKISSNRRFIGWLIVLIKKIIRKLIRPIITPIVNEQNYFNTSISLNFAKLQKDCEKLNIENKMLKIKIKELQNRKE